MTTKRITDVDFLDKLESNESFFVNKNNAIRQIDKANIVFGITNGGTGATDAATARANLGAADIETVNDIETSLDGLLTDFSTYMESTDEIIEQIFSRTTPIDRGGTGSNDGSIGLKNLLASGYTILSPYQYGEELPQDNSPETIGRIYLKKVNVKGSV